MRWELSPMRMFTLRHLFYYTVPFPELQGVEPLPSPAA